MITLNQDGWILRHIYTKAPITVGQEVRCFRGEKDTVLGGQPPLKPSSTGRVWTDRGEFFPAVFDLEWVRDR